MKDLTKGNPMRLILAFAIPVMAGNLFQLFYNLADTRIVGSFLGDTALTAVGATNSLNSLIVGFLTGLANGFAIITARHFGANDNKMVKKSVAAILVLGLAISVALTLLSVGFLTPLLRALNTPENLLAQSASYFRIILYGLTASMLYNGCAAVLRAVGDTITPLVFLMFSTILNVGLDLFFVCVLHAGVTGAAVATVLAQVVSGLLCVAYIYKRYPVLHPEKEDFRITPWLASQLLGSGLSMGFMMSLVNFGSVLLQGAINTFGEATILAHTAARRLTELFMLPFSVFGTTMATYCSQNWGAKKPGRIRSGMLQSLLICWIWCALVLLVVYTAVPSLVQLVTGTETAEVIETASLYLRIDTLLYFVTAVICVLRNALQGIGDLITPIFSSFLELFGKLAAVLFLTPRLGYMGVILAEPIVWVIMVIPLIVTSVKRLGRLPADASEPCAAEGSPR